jgi:hypothetical protein
VRLDRPTTGVEQTAGEQGANVGEEPGHHSEHADHAGPDNHAGHADN